jgi:NADH-quinone oxidoreductase subunit G
MLKWFCRELRWSEPYFFSLSSQERKVRAAVSHLDEDLALSLRELEAADFILVAGADPVNEAPMLALALRQAWRRKGKVVVLDPRPVFLSFACEHLSLAPGELNAGLGILGAAALSGRNLDGLDAAARNFLQASPGDLADPEVKARLSALGQRLGQSTRPVIVCGTDIVRESTPALAAVLARLLRAAGLAARLFYLLPGANAYGAGLLSSADKDRSSLVESLESGAIKALVVVESDPYWDYPDRRRLVKALEKLELLVVLDFLPSPLVQRADIVLPTRTLFEGSPSSFVNQEGRLQLAPPVHLGGAPLAQVSPEGHPPRTFLSHVPGGELKSAAEILLEVAAAMSAPVALAGDELWNWLAQENPVFARIAGLFEPPPGARVLPEASPDQVVYPNISPIPGPLVQDRLELLLVDQTFGTEELAGYSKPIHQVEEPPGLLMHPEDAARLGFAAGDQVALKLPGGELRVPLKVAENMAPGVLVLARHRQLDWRLAPDYQLSVSYGDLAKVED